MIVNFSIRRITTLLFAAIATFFVAEAKFTVIIDPGHGDQDHGAIGKISSEKDINLAVALRVGEMIKKNMPDVKIVFTRDDDTFVPLQGRADIANKAKGDLFISIHTNSVDKKSKNYRTVQGASVYTLGFKKSNENLAVAMRENAVMKLESDYSTTYEGFDPSSTESYIIFEMSQNLHMVQSIEAANEIQKELVTTAGRYDRGVRQANFWVLFKTSMPAILVELDFICNPEMERFMNSSEGKEKLATAIYNGFARYKILADKRNGIISAPAKILSAPKESKTDSVNERAQEHKQDKDATPDKDESVNPIAVEDTPIIYKVQFCTSPTKLPKNSPALKGITNVEYYKDGNILKYTTGQFTDSRDAAKRLNEVKRKFPDAFIIKTRGGKRIK
ncbi:MAG: N-acetylmuramoyl-L-alanine amidase [Barnesiella sp.]|nr:N-acetylmuramoyl-L-alanine amidase [Barnesiella sp.]